MITSMKVNADFLKKVMNCGDDSTEISFEIDDWGNKYLAKASLVGMAVCADIGVSNVLLEPDEEDKGNVSYITIRLGAFVSCDCRKVIDEKWADFIQREYRRIYGKDEDNQ